MHLSDFIRPFSLICEMENTVDNKLACADFQGAANKKFTTVTFPVLGKNAKHQIVIYEFYGVENSGNNVRHIFPVQGQIIHSLTQSNTKYLIAGLDKELRIYDIAASTVVRSVNC